MLQGQGDGEAVSLSVSGMFHNLNYSINVLNLVLETDRQVGWIRNEGDCYAMSSVYFKEVYQK